MDILESLQWRYATKKFDTSKNIETTKINRLTEAFNLTATSYGLQPIKLVVVSNKQLQEQMLPAAFNQLQVSTASHVFVICIEKEIDSDFIAKYFEQMKQLRPDRLEEVVAYEDVLQSRFKVKTEAEINLWATKQAYLALGNLLTVCAVEQIDSCPMEGFLPAEIDRILNLEAKNLSSILLLPVGVRDQADVGAHTTKVRRSIHDIVEHIN